MFENLIWTHLAIIAAVGLLVFGPDRLPGAIRRSAAALRQLRAQLADATSGLREEFGPELDELREPLAELQRLRGTTPRAAITRHLLNGDDTGAATFDHSPAALAVEPHHDDAGPPPRQSPANDRQTPDRRKMTMAQKAVAKSTTRTTAERIRDLDKVEVTVPVLGQIRIPRPERLAFYGGLAALAALQLIDWPIAAALAVGHLLSEDHHSRVAQELGAALEEA